LAVARGTASALVVALVGASVWRFIAPAIPQQPTTSVAEISADSPASQPRIVRADTYLAVAALEDHIASLDDALNVARLREGPAEVARLERTRAELLDSYAQVRYAELVSANF
jgi:peroxiredoxin